MATGKEVGGAVGGTSVIDDGKDPALLIEDTAGLDFIEIDTENERLLLAGGGAKVGVNKAAPLAQLHVRTADSGQSAAHAYADELVVEGSASSGITIQSGNANTGAVVFADSGSNYQGAIQYVHGTNRLDLHNNGAVRLSIDSGGKITTGGEDTALCEAGGIHIYESDTGVTLSGADGADMLVIESNESDGAGLTILTDTNRVGKIHFSDEAASGKIEYDHSTNTMSFNTFNNERLTIKSSGFVGVGSTAPVHKVHVQDGDLGIVTNSADEFGKSLVFTKSRNATDGSATVVQDDDILGNIEFQGAEDGDSWATGAKIFARVNGTPGDGDMPTELVFATSRDGTETPLEYMRLSNTGTLQILNHEGENRFSFSSDADDATLQIDSAAGSTRTVLKSATTGSYMRYSALNLGNNNTTSEAQLHVVVGTSNTAGDPSAISVVNDRNCIKCEMDDTTNNPIVVDLANTGTGDAIKYAGPSSTFFHVKSDGDCENTNNSYGGISDRRLKENITDATSKLSDINKLQVRNFNFIGDDLKQIGLVADEVAEVFPGLVKSSDARTYSRTESVGDDGQIEVSKELIGGLEDQKSVKYSVLVPMLIKAVQELSARIEELENDGD
ncbi:hypothetical protein CMI37_08230 [Candidatus Pacearchaeota archaeon]|nr:hypothetical protein [Candidatus Pacearchaeota archaeon]